MADFLVRASWRASYTGSRRAWTSQRHLFFCSNETSRDLAGTVTGTESVCLQISRDGSLGSKAWLTRSTPGGLSLTARN
jgi:hypothetical protein